MKIPLAPPPYLSLLSSVLSGPQAAQDFANLLLKRTGVTVDGKYRHWDILRHLQPPEGFSTESWWLAIKTARMAVYQPIPILGCNGQWFQLSVPDVAQRMLHQIDRDASGTIEISAQVTNPHTRDT